MGTTENPSRIVDPRGYVLVRVGREHHLADVRGYAYEHRLVMETKLGRKLAGDELVHHIDENKGNNDPSNLAVTDRRSHIRHHNPRQGTESEFCRRGHRKHRRKTGGLRCRQCENEAERRRYHERSKNGNQA